MMLPNYSSGSGRWNTWLPFTLAIVWGKGSAMEMKKKRKRKRNFRRNTKERSRSRAKKHRISYKRVSIKSQAVTKLPQSERRGRSVRLNPINHTWCTQYAAKYLWKSLWKHTYNWMETTNCNAVNRRKLFSLIPARCQLEYIHTFWTGSGECYVHPAT